MKKTMRLLLVAASMTACGGVFANSLSFAAASDSTITQYFSVTPVVTNKLILDVEGEFAQFSSIKFDIDGGPSNVLASVNKGKWNANFNDRTNDIYQLIGDQSYKLKVTVVTNNLNAGETAPWKIHATTGDVVSAVPEPESYATLLAGLGLVGSLALRRKKST